MWATSGRPLIFTQSVTGTQLHSFIHALFGAASLQKQNQGVSRETAEPTERNTGTACPSQGTCADPAQEDPRRPHTQDIAQETMTEHYFQIKNITASYCVDYSESRLRQNNGTYPVPTFLLYIWNTAHLLSREPYILSKQIYRAIYLLPGNMLSQIINTINEV